MSLNRDEFDCDYTYYKPSGKWYASGRGHYPRPVAKGYNAIDRASIWRCNNGSMPALSGDAREFVVIVTPDDNCTQEYATPHLLQPVALTEIKSSFETIVKKYGLILERGRIIEIQGMRISYSDPYIVRALAQDMAKAFLVENQPDGSENGRIMW